MCQFWLEYKNMLPLGQLQIAAEPRPLEIFGNKIVGIVLPIKHCFLPMLPPSSQPLHCMQINLSLIYIQQVL